MISSGRVAIIPARGGSKGVPQKNIRLLGGHPLVAFTIAAAKRCKKLDRVIVSTDSPRIADIARQHGAEVPFMRPSEFALDSSPGGDVILHALDWLSQNEDHLPEYFVQLLPTTPLRDPALIDAAIDFIRSDPKATSLRSAHELPEPPQKMMGIKDGYFVGLFPHDKRPDYHNLPRQSFPPAYHPNGYVDIFRSEFLQQQRSLYGDRILAFVTPFVIEIDSIEQFELLEMIIERKGHPLLSHLRSDIL